MRVSHAEAPRPCTTVDHGSTCNNVTQSDPFDQVTLSNASDYRTNGQWRITH